MVRRLNYLPIQIYYYFFYYIYSQKEKEAKVAKAKAENTAVVKRLPNPNHQEQVFNFL